MLHHSIVAGTPLTLGYWLAVRRWWRPTAFTTAEPLSPRAMLAGGIGLLLFRSPLGIVAGFVSPLFCGVASLIGLLAPLVKWRTAGKQIPEPTRTTTENGGSNSL